MAQDYFEDINPQENGTGSRSIRNIEVGPRARSNRRVLRDAPSGRSRRGGKKLLVWAIALLALVGLGAVVFFMFRETTVSVTPRTHTVVFDSGTTFTAVPAGQEVAPGELEYTVLTKEYEESVSVSATGTEYVEEQASGEITVYNDFSEDPQRLIANTRFETPEGLVFRIRNPITVPGRTASGPGSINATVYADEPGEEYNIGPVARFTLPGLRTSAPDMFEDIYARSTGSMTGGAVGEQPIVDDTTMDAARRQLQAALESRARAELDSAFTGSEGYVFPELAQIRFESLTPVLGGDSGVQVREKAVVEVPVFAPAQFAGTIAEAMSADASENPIHIGDISALSAQNVSEGEVIYQVDSFELSLSGTGLLVWDVDTEALREALAGRDREAFEAIVANFPGVETAAANIRPFWRGSFPDNPGDIIITLAGAE